MSIPHDASPSYIEVSEGSASELEMPDFGHSVLGFNRLHPSNTPDYHPFQELKSPYPTIETSTKLLLHSFTIRHSTIFDFHMKEM
jgi:hypothetical protein